MYNHDEWLELPVTVVATAFGVTIAGSLISPSILGMVYRRKSATSRTIGRFVESNPAALTEPERLIAWLARAQVALTPGGRVQLKWLNSESVARGNITAFDPPRLVAYNTDIHGRLRWELQAEGSGCLLTFTCTLADNLKEHLARNLAGWHVHLDHLADALEGQQVDWPRWTEDYMGRWTEYHDRYAAKLAER